MSYYNISYQKAQFKASSFSFERKEDFHEQLYWDSNVPFEGACRGLELAIWRRDGVWPEVPSGPGVGWFMVGGQGGPTAHPLADYLGYLLSWHQNSPLHDPVFVSIDIMSTKGEVTNFPAEIDGYLKAWFDQGLVFKPGQLSTDLKNLIDASKGGKWPSIHGLQGKFIFCLSGKNETWKSYYAENMTLTSLCFVDATVSDKIDTIEKVNIPPNRVFVNMELSIGDFSNWRLLVPELNSAGYIVRGYTLNTENLFDIAILAQVNILATDKVTGQSWARLGVPQPFQPIRLP